MRLGIVAASEALGLGPLEELLDARARDDGLATGLRQRRSILR